MAEIPAAFGGDKAGGFPEKMILRNTVAKFERDGRYNQGKTLCLLLRGDAEDAVDVNGDPVDMNLDENPLYYPCGDGWDSFDDGATAEHSSGKADKSFNENSAPIHFIQKLIAIGGGEDLVAKAQMPTVAAAFSGWDLYLEREEFDYGINRKTNQPMKTSRMMPAKILGVSGATEKKAPAKKAVEETAAEGTGLLAGLDKAVLTKLKVAFKKAGGDEGAFADAAIEIDEVQGDDALVSAVADGSLYAELSS